MSCAICKCYDAPIWDETLGFVCCTGVVGQAVIWTGQAGIVVQVIVSFARDFPILAGCVWGASITLAVNNVSFTDAGVATFYKIGFTIKICAAITGCVSGAGFTGS